MAIEGLNTRGELLEFVRRELLNQPGLMTVQGVRGLADQLKELLDAIEDLTASGISGGIFDAKGDLIAGTADDAYDNLPAGANGRFLKTDSAQTMGLVWANLAISDTSGLQTALDGKQPLDSDLTALAALTTTSFGRSVLELADAAAGRTLFGAAASSHTHAQSDVTDLVSDLAGKQPLDSDLTALAALTTTSYGRSLLEAANAAALRTLAGVAIGTDVQAYDSDLAAIAALSTTSFGRSVLPLADAAALRTLAGVVIGADVQAYDSDLAAIAALSTTSFGRSVLTQADASALRTLAGLVIGTDVQAYDAELAALAGLTSAADKAPYFTGSGTAALMTVTSFIRTLLDDADAATARGTLAVPQKPGSSTDGNLAGWSGTGGDTLTDSGAKASNVPDDDQYGALNGSYGTPAASNPFVTQDDPVFDAIGTPGRDLEFDAESNVAAGTGTLSWTHTPVGTPTGIIVLIAQNSGSTDEVTGVTYGGVSMQEVPKSPLSHPSGSEDGGLYAYFLGWDIPSGAQTVSVSVNGTGSSKRAVAFSVISGRPVRVAMTASLDSSGVANPSVSLPLPSAMESAVFGVLHSGQDAVSSLAAGASYTEVLEHDFGSQTASWIRRTANTSGDATTVDWTATSEEAAVLAVAVTQVPIRDFGRVTVLPSKPSVGDRCSFVGDAAALTSDAVAWDAVYDGEGTYGWLVVGGDPIISNDRTATGTQTGTSYAAFETPPSIVTPVGGIWRVRNGFAHYYPTTNGYAYQAAHVAGIIVSDSEVYAYGDSTWETETGHWANAGGMAAGTTIDARNKVGAGGQQYTNRWLEAKPTRIG